MSNLICLAKPVNVGSKGALKGKPKVFIADAAIRNAVLLTDDVLSEERGPGLTHFFPQERPSEPPVCIFILNLPCFIQI